MYGLLQKLAVIREKYYNIMVGRYAVWDTLNKDILIFCVAVNFINLFIGSLILRTVSAVFFLAAVFRVFSKNILKREIENRKYRKFHDDTVQWFKIMYKRAAEIKTHRYYKCKNCSAYIRVPYKKGEHTLDCPKCGKEFKVKIL